MSNTAIPDSPVTPANEQALPKSPVQLSSPSRESGTPGSRKPHYARLFFSRWNFAVAVALAFLWVEADYENRLYDALVANALKTPSSMSRQEKVLALMQTTHTTVVTREPLFRDIAIRGVHAVLLRSGDTELLQADGSCGSCAHIFAEACQRIGIPVRCCQLSDSRDQTEHVIAEALVDGRWVVVDPLFPQVFHDSSGKLVGCAEVNANWEYYKNQAPKYREFGYQFGNVRYTNWSKIPVVMPMVRELLKWIFGEQRTNTFSLRTYCLNIYATYFRILLGFTIVLNVFLILREWLRSRRKIAAPEALGAGG